MDIMSLTFAKGYLAALLGNVRVVKFLAANQADILGIRADHGDKFVEPVAGRTLMFRKTNAWPVR